MKCNNICIIGVQEEEEKKGIENTFEEIMAESFPNLVKEKHKQIQEAERVPNQMNPQRPTLRHVITKMAKITDK